MKKAILEPSFDFMQTRFFTRAVFGLSILILGLVFWIFQGDLESLWISLQTPRSTPYVRKEIPIIDEALSSPKGKKTELSYQGTLKEVDILIDNGYYPKAARTLSELLRRSPEPIEGYLKLGEVYLRSQDKDRLARLLEEVEKRFPKDDRVALLRVKKWIAERQFGTVLSLLGASESISGDLQWYKVVLQSLQNDHKSAKASLELAMGMEDCPHKMTNSVPCLTPELRKKIEDWKGVYDQFDVLSDGQNAHLFALFSKVLASQEDPVLGREFADQSIKDEIGYIDAWVLRGYNAFLQEHYSTALEDFRQAYRLDPERPETQYFLGLTLYELEKYEEAALYFEPVLNHPDFEFSEGVRWKLVDIYSKQKKYEKALALYESLLESDQNPQKFVSAIDIAVNILGKPEKALEFTKVLIERDPESLFFQNLYAWALIASKDYVEAKDVLESALEKDSQYARTYFNLGLLSEQQNRFTQAREYYKKAYQYGRSDEKLLSVVNLASERYNALLHKEDQPAVPEVITDRNSHSP